MAGIDFLATAVCFSLLGYALCYLQMKVQDADEKREKAKEQSITYE